MPGSAGSRLERERRQRLGADVEGQQLQDVSGSGISAAAQREHEERHDLGGGVGEDVDDEFADVVVDAPAGLDRGRRWWRSCRR